VKQQFFRQGGLSGVGVRDDAEYPALFDLGGRVDRCHEISFLQQAVDL
jgi:hypothetical protein